MGMFFINPRKTVILRACDFLDLSCLLHIQPAVSQAPQQNRHPERSASQIYRKQRALRRAVEEPVLSGVEGTPAMLVGRCSRGLSGRELQRKIKSHNLRPERRDLRCANTPPRSQRETPPSLNFLLTCTSTLVHYS